MPANFNNSAWFYDQLSRVVYGKALINAQVYLLHFIPQNSSILIVGGGTGWLLEELAKIHPADLQITYAEVSARMMSLSKKRDIGGNNINYINDDIENFKLNDHFDIVITAFLFDNFTEQTVKKVFGHIHSLLKPTGYWLNSDFQLSGKWWQKVLLNTMFLFFRLICKIEASKLPDINKQFNDYGYKAIASQTFFGNFILSQVYKNRRGY